MSWLSGWKNRIKLIIDSSKVDEDLTNFPVLITLSSGCGISSVDVTNVFTELGSNSKKIAITNVDNTAQYYTEIDSWDQDNQQAWLWAKISTVSSGSDTVVYLYYDSNQEDNSIYIGTLGETPAQNVWSNGYKGVYHMSQDPSGGSNAIKDSTSNTNNGTPDGSMTSGDLVDGLVNKGVDFDGGNDDIGFGSPSDFDFGQNECSIEIVCWGDASGGQRLFSNGWWGYNKGICVKGTVFAIGATTGNSSDDAQISHNLTSNTWHNISMRYVYGDVLEAYRDGDLVNDLDISSLTNLSATHSYNSYLGSHNGSSEFYDGIISEFRISSSSRSSAWMKASYHSYFDTLITYEPFKGYFDGYVYELGTPVVRSLYLHNRDSGGHLMNTTTSSGNGYYYLETTYSGAHYIVCLDDVAGEDYNDLIIGNVYPTTISG